MKKSLVMALVVLSQTVFAQSNLTQKEKDEIYVLQCGSIQQVADASGVKLTDVKEEDKKSLIDSRKTTVDILRHGSKAVKSILDSGSKSDVGVFGLLMACGTVVEISEKIEAEGCVDLEKNETIRSMSDGVEACREIAESLNK